MIRSIYIENFKSYKEASLPLAPLTLLIGANASGKSNALEALRFLSWLAQGQKLSSLQYIVNDSEQVVRGRVSDLPRAGEQEFTLGCSLTEKEFSRLNIQISLRAEDELHITHEEVVSVRVEDKYLYQTVHQSYGASTDMRIAYNNFARGGRNPQLNFSDQTAVFSQWTSVVPALTTNQKAKRQLKETSEAFEQALSTIIFLDPNPAKMREYSFLSDKKLLGDGSNLSSVLYHLWNSEQNQDQNQRRILNCISSLPEQDIRSVDFLSGPRGEVMLQLVETFGGTDRHCDASLLSDGTLRVLSIVAAMLSAPSGSLVVIEEIGNGVHPSRANHLLSEIDQIARTRHLRVLISSHNPALLDALPLESIGDAVFCYRDQKDGSSKLINLSNIQDYPELMSQGSLGELVTKGLLDRFVKTYEGKEQKIHKALEWLQSVSNAE